ncbi:MAG: DEAD/DEAH box helicase, partial [Candidatus Marinimicrobia bacterium]|nr:DEAD/DEAH box helicase [Candidatus Neomarinimicrobiota bacterium]
KKSKTKESAEKIVDELITLYSVRQNSSGYSFSSDDELQIEMESEFPHQETPDQIIATEEIKSDMESNKPMDRLLCGDVGFGKTEVAIRAAFKAILDNKQVAILVPTTILADQHYNSFKNRLQKYPIIIEKLSRFVSKKNQKDILSALEKGKLDIIIGTHRLLSNDVSFDDLGLLIIDEEHRFGVKKKEKIKNIKKHVDVLSLTATPIPRTLQFSLIGARDFSQINTPPKYRLPIITEIINFDENFIKERIQFELNRSGQVYFVHNRVKTIKSVTARLKSIISDARIDFAHGQMSETKLERVIDDFINQKVDVLVTTTIIESGIDISNVNTMFIDKAHNFGLAQLYQLRGRVGRSNRRAFCYLIAPKMKNLNAGAVKRLNTIKRYTSLGSGYNIALSDMEIRGAGNLFGVEQSGNIQKIGYDLYVKILQDTFKDRKDEISDAIKTERSKKDSIQNINVKIISPYSIYIPDDYIESQKIRLDFYKRISEAGTINSLKNLRSEIKDRFGKLPVETINLFRTSRLKINSNKANISKIVIKNKGKCELRFRKDSLVDNINRFLLEVRKTCNKMDISYKFKPTEKLVLILNFNKDDILEHLNNYLLELIDKINDFK